jgi:putative transposase
VSWAWKGTSCESIIGVHRTGATPDIFSRKIAGWEVHTRESAEHAADLVCQAFWAEGCLIRPLVLHADNGSPMKGATMKATLERLGVIASYSRPRVSDDCEYSAVAQGA